MNLLSAITMLVLANNCSLITTRDANRAIGYESGQYLGVHRGDPQGAQSSIAWAITRGGKLYQNSPARSCSLLLFNPEAVAAIYGLTAQAAKFPFSPAP